MFEDVRNSWALSPFLGWHFLKLGPRVVELSESKELPDNMTSKYEGQPK